MARNLPLLPLCVLLAGFAIDSAAQSVPVHETSLPRQASAYGGRLQGMVRDEAGSAVDGVSVLAVGTTLAVAMSDSRGRFSLALPAGEYVLRATREGYVSTYREAVRIQANAWLERDIRLTRGLVQPVTSDSAESPTVDIERDNREIAWRLRHLPRSVLRDVSHYGLENDQPPTSTPFSTKSVVGTAGRSAASLFANTDFTGQLNLLTSTSLAAAKGPELANWSRGIADAVIGAPFGTSGDWSVRGAVAAGDTSAWTLLGEYRARADREHAFQLAVSYSTQGFAAGGSATRPVAVMESRSAGSIHAADRWLVGRRLELDYSARIDHYDYLSVPSLLSPGISARVLLPRHTFITITSEQQMLAPGAEQFLPPSAAGPWLPPERTFSALSRTAELRPARLRHHRVGVIHVFGDQETNEIGIEWFTQATAGQMATLFATDPASTLGHYYVATAGNVDIQGWRLHVSGDASRYVRATFDYSGGGARWSRTRAAAALRRTARTAARYGAEQIHTLLAAVDVSVPETATHVTAGYQFSTAFNRPDRPGPDPILANRFNLEVRQQLPYQPLRGGTLNLLFTVRQLLHDAGTGSMYDELLTLRPPARVTGGLQLWF